MKNSRNQASDEEKDYYRNQKKFWGAFARFYNFAVAPASGLRERVVGFAAAPRGAKILDVATGTGKQAFAFARHGYDVTGIDLSEAMLKMANRGNKYKNLKLQIADAADLSFEADAFDVSTVSFALHEMPLTARERALQEMVRVTKKTGMILIVDFALPRNRTMKFLIYYFVKSFEGEHYVKYLKNGLKTSLEKTGIAIDRELPVLFGGATVIRGTIAANN